MSKTINDALWTLMDMNENPSKYICKKLGELDTTDEFDEACAVITEACYTLLNKKY